MGVVVTIGGEPYEVESYSVNEQSTPLEGDDSSGGVGEFSILTPDQPNIFTAYGAEVLIRDEDRGEFMGSVDIVSRNDSTGLYEVSGPSRLAPLNLFNIQAQPFVGNLNNAIAYYLSLAGIEDNWEVEEDIRYLWVTAPGWYGELWYHLKQLVTAYGVEIALSGTQIRVRRPRQTVADEGFFDSRDLHLGGPDLAQTVEVYSYSTRVLESDVVYPPYNYINKEDILTFTAGEMTEFDLELPSSISRIEEPTMVSSWDEVTDKMSVFAISKSDGVALTPTEFYSMGGYIQFEIGEDTKSILVRVYAPLGILNSDDKFVDRFSFSLGKRDAGKKAPEGSSSEDDGNDYIVELPETEFPTLQILGDGIETVKTLHTFLTGVSKNVTDREVGITVDNPFIRNVATAQQIGVNLACKYSTSYVTLTGNVTKLRSNQGLAEQLTLTYDEFYNIFGDMTWTQWVTEYGDMTYQEFMRMTTGISNTPVEHKVMGSAAGTRVWDEDSKHWFRVRDAEVNSDLISIDAEPDTMFRDVQQELEGLTYAQVQTAREGETYMQVNAKGAQL